jgi:hypothetical protein
VELSFDRGVYYNSDANFSSMYFSLLTLFRISRGEDWQTLFTDIVWLECDGEGTA